MIGGAGRRGEWMASLRAVLVVVAVVAAGRADAVRRSASGILDAVDSPRGRAMAGATTALGADPTLAWSNPTACAGIGRPSLTLGGQRGFQGAVVWQAVGAVPVSRRVVGAVGLSGFDGGSMTLNHSDGTSRRVKAQQDLLLVGNVAVALFAPVSVGVSVKGVRSELIDEFTAAAFAFDAGGQVRIGRSLKVGLVAQNLGSKLKYRDDGMSLPAIVRAGVAYLADFGAMGAVIAVADEGISLNSGEVTWRGGVEYEWRGLVAIRGGVELPPGDALGRYSAGVGIRAMRYRLDYAIQFDTIQFDTTFDMPHLLTFTVSF